MNDDTQSDPIDATGRSEESVSVPTFESTHEKITISVDSPEGTFSVEFYVEPGKSQFTTETRPLFGYDDEDEEYEQFMRNPSVVTRMAPWRRTHVVNLMANPIAHPETGVVYVKRVPTRNDGCA